MSGHSDGILHGKFCAQRKEPCTHIDGPGTEYRKNCDPDPSAWAADMADASFAVGSMYIDGRNTTTEISAPNAHHLLCVAEVSKVVVSEGKIKRIVKNTKWCINDKPNIIPLPLWGHTIAFYCRIKADDWFESERWFRSRKRPPKFANYPMHDYDHLKYNEEVEKRLKAIVNQVKTSKKKHEDKTDQLRAKLVNASANFRTKLTNRGNRGGGTHNSWYAGRDGNNRQWYKAFSMAARPTPKDFVENIQEEKVNKLANSYYWFSN